MDGAEGRGGAGRVTGRLSQTAKDHGHQHDAAYWAKQVKRAEETPAGIRQLLADRTSSQDHLVADASIGHDDNNTD